MYELHDILSLYRGISWAMLGVGSMMLLPLLLGNTNGDTKEKNSSARRPMRKKGRIVFKI